MLKKVMLLVILSFSNIVEAQVQQISDDLEVAFRYYEMAFDNIKSGKTAINYCFSINNPSTLRTQILYSCAKPVEAKSYIENVILKINKVERNLQLLKCPSSSNYALQARASFYSAISNLQLGALAIMTASEQRQINNIYKFMNNSMPFWNNSLSDLNTGINQLNSIMKELEKCNNSQPSSKLSMQDCNSIINFIKANGEKIETIQAYTLNSSWLNDVVAYRYDGKYYIIAQLKMKENNYQVKSYVYCNIPISNWNYFKNTPQGTFGERFHLYISEHTCNCE